jgi:molybdopterin-containing oxidoreductase family iron-sulfur binding subunit
VKTACQQTCPTQAITFGSIADAGDPVNRARDSRRTYAVLDDLATEPRVRYLAAVRNPNPDLERGS